MSKQSEVISRLRAGNRTPNEEKILAALMQPSEDDGIDFERLIDSLDPSPDAQMADNSVRLDATSCEAAADSKAFTEGKPSGQVAGVIFRERLSASPKDVMVAARVMQIQAERDLLAAPKLVDSPYKAPGSRRNRSKMCEDPRVHRAHEGCLGRQRAAKVSRPVCATVASALDAVWRKHGRHSVLHADSAELGIISPYDIARYALDVEKYEQIEFKQQDKFASFFTAIQRTNAIILDYAAQNLLPLTLRQIHYQMVVRHKDYPNTKTSYDHLAQDLVAARMAGFVPWNAIDDPTRGLHKFTGWESAQKRVADAAETFHLSRWANQFVAPIVLVEKDAALGIISRACNELDVPYASCKGYGSVSALRNQVANHCRVALDKGKAPVVIHLSDHDASGWDMPRNLEEYLDLLVGCHVDMRHIALTLDQIAQGYGDGNPLPSDPVKSADPRSTKYIAHLAERGLEAGAWEMDALSPADLHSCIVKEIDSCRDMTLWKIVEDAEAEQKQTITRVAENWNTPLPNDGEMQ